MTRILVLAICGALLIGSGCGRMRLVIDAVPAADDLTETVVMEDDSARPSFFGLAAPPKIALIDVSGVIVDAQRPGLLTPGENPVARFTEALKRAEEDSAVRAVIIRINSPGGTVTASDVMYREVLHFKQSTGKPVVISMADVAASGGYYIACAGDEIIANPTTVTGSIGVIIQTVNVYEGLRRIGVRAEAITSGPNKKMGTPFEPMTEEHRQLLQGIVNDFYENFVDVVKRNRPTLSHDDLQWITDGRVITGRQAAAVGVVDRLGDLRDAFEAAKARADLTTARLVKYHRPLEHVASPYALMPSAAGGSQVNLLQLNVSTAALGEQPGFLYMWDPAIW